MGADYLSTIAGDILTVASNSLVQSRTLNPPPKRQNTAWGLPPMDGCNDSCDGQLTVHLDPNNAITHDFVQTLDRQDHIIVPKANFVITLFRCVPVLADDGTPPDADVLTASAEGLMRDLWSLMAGLYGAIQTYTLFTGQQQQSYDVKLGAIRNTEPQGGCGGFSVALSILLNDNFPTG